MHSGYFADRGCIQIHIYIYLIILPCCMSKYTIDIINNLLYRTKYNTFIFYIPIYMFFNDYLLLN